MSIIKSFTGQVFNGVTFSNITATETDVGTVSSFVGNSGVLGFGNVPLPFSSTVGPTWASTLTGVTGPGSSETITFSYNVSTAATQGINALQLEMSVDSNVGGTGSITAVQQVYSNGVLVGQSTINQSNPATGQGFSAPTDLPMYAAYSNLTVVTTVTLSEPVTAAPTNSISLSVLEAGFQPVALVNQASFGDYVFLDSNGNGVQDSGETGVSGVTVKLLDANGNFLGATTTTDATGHYSFANLNPGVYEAQFVAPSGYAFTTALAGGNTALDSNANATTGITGPITLAAGQNDTSIDAGLTSLAAPPVVINAIVFADTNGNGVQDIGETGLSGITVNLLNSSGSVIASTVTGPTGQYAFNEPAGTYTLQVVAPNGAVISTPITGSGLGSGTPGSTNYVDPTSGDSPSLVLPSGTSTTVAAGLYRPVSVSGIAFVDANGNGVSTGDATLAGVAVMLSDASGPLYATTTAADGSYSFTGLKPGTYTVTFTAPSGDTFTTEHVGTNTAIDSDVNASGVTNAITLTSGQSATHIDAGLIVPAPPAPATIGDFVFLDTNGNGLQDSGETGISGVTVQLLSSAGAVLASTTTDTTGHYSFSTVAGSYEVKVVAPASYKFTAQNVGTNDAINSDVNSSGVTNVFTVTAGQINNNIDAGLFQTASIGDFVFNDTNHNGIQDTGETGLSGVTVKLLNGTGSSVLATTTTDATGHYLFSGLTPSSYEVQFVTPAGDVFSPMGQGTNAALDSNANQTTGITAPITLTSGQSNLTIDAGMYKANSGPCITVDKIATKSVVCNGDNVTFTFKVTNTGTQALNTVKISDNIGTSANPCYVTPTAVTSGCSGYNVGDSNHNGILDVGETWQFSTTFKAVADTTQVWTPGGWTYNNYGCWGGWSYTCAHWTTTPVDSTIVDKVTVSAQTICSTTTPYGGSCDTGYENACSYQNYNNYGCGGYNSWGGGYGCGNYNSCPTSAWGYDDSNNYCSGTYGTSWNSGEGCYTSTTNYATCNYSNICGSTSSSNNFGGCYSTGDNGCGGNSACTPTVVTATDSSSVEVLACNNNISTSGCGTSGDLNKYYGHAEKIEFTYKPCDTVSSTALSAGVCQVSGHNGNQVGYVEITNCSNAFSTTCSTYFRGNLAAGESCYADATKDLTNCRTTTGCFDTSNKTYAFVFNSESDYLNHVAPVQTICIDTTGATAIHANDQYGSLQVCGYVGSTSHSGYLCA